MTIVESLKKPLRAIDLCLAACRRRQSPRTGFIHHFWGGDEAQDTIPLYENFCFALALYRQKTLESALEGKGLFERLLAFQVPSGNFPVYLHEFPRCHNSIQALKIAPLLIQLQRHFGTVLSSDLKQLIARALEKMLAIEPPAGPWAFRHKMCSEGEAVEQPRSFSSADWTEWLISAQLDLSAPAATPLFHSQLQAYIGPPSADLQEGFEPRPSPIEWLLAEREEQFSPRLLRDHPLQMHLAALWPLEPLAQSSPDWHVVTTEDTSTAWGQQTNDKCANLLRILWQEEHLHSLVLPRQKARITILDSSEILFDLPEETGEFEIVFYCDATPEVDLTIGGRKGTVFRLGEEVAIATPKHHFTLRFELVSGEGDFLGHLSRANRPSQVLTRGFEAYDWQIGLRTLRRSREARIRVILLMC